jgi:uncharacterized protein with PIN domain
VAPASVERPDAVQLDELRRLADRCGETFASPSCSAEAEAEIARLRGRPVSSGLERWLDRIAVGGGPVWGSEDAAAVDASEFYGCAAACPWRHLEGMA